MTIRNLIYFDVISFMVSIMKVLVSSANKIVAHNLFLWYFQIFFLSFSLNIETVIKYNFVQRESNPTFDH
jgi:hypothetical protein